MGDLRIGARKNIQYVSAANYVRVSSKDQEKEGFSVPAQLRLLHSYASEHGLTILREFEDVATAKRAGRSGFAAMVAFLKRRPGCR